MNRMFVLLCFAMLLTLPPHSARAGSGEDSAGPQQELTDLSLEELMQLLLRSGGIFSASGPGRERGEGRQHGKTEQHEHPVHG